MHKTDSSLLVTLPKRSSFLHQEKMKQLPREASQRAVNATFSSHCFYFFPTCPVDFFNTMR